MKKLMRCLVFCGLSVSISQMAMAEKALHLFNWNDYIAEDTVARFEAQCGCKVVQDYFSSTEEMMAKLLAGAGDYDVAIPTQNAVEALIKQGFLMPLDKSKLTNIGNMSPGYMDKAYDKGNQFSLPYAFTTTLIGYNENKIKELGLNPADWSIIFDPAVLAKIKGKVTVMDDSEELFAAALKYLGYSINDTDEKHLKEAQAVILKAKPYWAAFNSSSYIKELTVGNIWVAHGYSSDMFQARVDAADAGRDFSVSFVMPKQGGVLALDNMVIPKKAREPELAHQFINFMMIPENAAELTNVVGTGNPNVAAMPMIDESILAVPAIFPDAELQTKLETIGARTAKERRFINKLWTDIKAR
ncbi:spermidine/putrescine ABC transporter substrate-binding protein [Spongiibacter taiwanensis]|uniref:polyamine ABC transporter substrate-binding protein n=1 Tax=Spongiibacter taiwanensis TaxID=1748242 RepID=UPI002034EAEB|nr:spermidine/putrescine ABC transporter substrate-binding protein [Spongiibacter taiwanensis]USA42378.1 spermidine/putrescine ABC transporter substrate-binding protein [Spongiibacter taiwanensis]